jgi:hypothetical protein
MRGQPVPRRHSHSPGADSCAQPSRVLCSAVRAALLPNDCTAAGAGETCCSSASTSIIPAENIVAAFELEPEDYLPLGWSWVTNSAAYSVAGRRRGSCVTVTSHLCVLECEEPTSKPFPLNWTSESRDRFCGVTGDSESDATVVRNCRPGNRRGPFPVPSVGPLVQQLYLSFLIMFVVSSRMGPVTRR